MRSFEERVPRLLSAPVRGTGALFLEIERPAPAGRKEKYLLVAILILAALVRFWELGSFSLHKSDEDTTVLAAVHVLEDGVPRFPSGVAYGRAVAQSYLIAGSMALFGESEWSARLPSALCGILAVWLGWLVARRFLPAPWRLGFALALALLPAMIADSQEARMYGFMVTTLLAATWQVFRWEDRFKHRHLTFAVFWILAAIQFQELALLGAGVLLFPGLSTGNIKRTAQGLLGLVAVGAGYLLISTWQGGLYPATLTHQYFPGWADPLTVPPEPVGASAAIVAGLAAALLALVMAVWSTKGPMVVRSSVVLLISTAFVSQAFLQYHLAALLWLSALVVGRRSQSLRLLPLLLLAAVAVALAATQVFMIMRTEPSLRQTAGAMIGVPSIWPYLQLAAYSWAAGALVAAGVLFAAWRLATGRFIHPVWMYFSLTVWAPLMVVGLYAWFVPQRYIEFALAPMLLTAFVAAPKLLASWGRHGAVVLLTAIVVVNPLNAWEAIVIGDRDADHRAAAQFLKDLPIRDEDVVIVEEVLMQKYYLDDVDYWLVSPQVAAQFVVREDGEYVDLYTHTPLVDSVDALERIIAEANGRRVFIVESSEGGDRTHNRGVELNALLESGTLREIYDGSNGSHIWLAGGE